MEKIIYELETSRTKKDRKPLSWAQFKTRIETMGIHDTDIIHYICVETSDPGLQYVEDFDRCPPQKKISSYI